MAFFRKLRERLFKSQAKLDAGLEELVEEDAADAAPDLEPAPPPNPATSDPASVRPTPSPPQPARAVPTPDPASAPAPVPIRAAAPAMPEPAPDPAPDPAPESAPEAAPDPAPDAAVEPDPEEATKAPGFFARAFGRSTRTRVLDDAMLESLEDVLIQADLGVDTALALSARLSERHYGRRVGTQELKRLLADEIAAILGPVAKPLPLFGLRPQVVLVVGVNGSGKTTTIGKLASQLKAAGKRVVIAAGDTFRAAAVEQLQVWGERAGVPVMVAPAGSDPASLAFEAFQRAEDEGADLLLIDTAGRLQNRQDLMEELAKIVRVLRKKDPSAPHNTVLVLDATTGQNAVAQVELVGDRNQDAALGRAVQLGHDQA
ncbi:MAG: signal recognition particle receptor subunit alpha [Pseudomonadota bacterium]